MATFFVMIGIQIRIRIDGEKLDNWALVDWLRDAGHFICDRLGRLWVKVLNLKKDYWRWSIISHRTQIVQPADPKLTIPACRYLSLT